jgi:hypothetical protein
MSSKPDVQLVAISTADGGVAVMQFVTRAFHKGEITWERKATDEAIVAEIAKSRIKAVAWQRIDQTSLPQDRSFRGAWKLEAGKVGVDMPRARDIHRQRMRDARAPKFAALDVEYQRADERGDAAAKADVANRKKILRDVTADPRIDAASTPDELKSVWPTGL